MPSRDFLWPIFKPVFDKYSFVRPMFGTINRSFYRLAIIVSCSNLMVKNYFVFDKEITKANSNSIMLILDGESLYSNLPLEETTKNIVNDFSLNKKEQIILPSIAPLIEF